MDKTAYAQPVYPTGSHDNIPATAIHITNAYLAEPSTSSAMPSAPPLSHQSSVFRFQNEGLKLFILILLSRCISIFYISFFNYIFIHSYITINDYKLVQENSCK